MSPVDYTSQRVRHELHARKLHVLRVEQRARHIVCITLGGEALQGFISAGFDDHIKIFLPRDGETEAVMPDVLQPGKRSDDPALRPLARDYTPRRYDPVRQELDIEFVIHGDGPGSQWAAQAQAGDVLGIAGPRGSFIVSPAFDWYLLAGDETAIPAMGRRIEELSAGQRAIVIVEVGDASDLPAWTARSNVDVRLALRGAAAAGTTDALLRAVQAVPLPDGVGHAWVGAESSAARTVRDYLLSAGIDKQHIRASSYWRSGAAGHHESIE